MLLTFSLCRSTRCAVSLRPPTPHRPFSRCPPPRAPTPRAGLSNHIPRFVRYLCGESLMSTPNYTREDAASPSTHLAGYLAQAQSRRPVHFRPETRRAEARFCDALPGVLSEGGKAGRRTVALRSRQPTGRLLASPAGPLPSRPPWHRRGGGSPRPR